MYIVAAHMQKRAVKEIVAAGSKKYGNYVPVIIIYVEFEYIHIMYMLTTFHDCTLHIIATVDLKNFVAKIFFVVCVNYDKKRKKHEIYFTTNQYCYQHIKYHSAAC